jgi:hypothetical protein
VETGHVTRMREKSNAYRMLAKKPEGKRPLGRPRRSWVNNIKIDLLEIGLSGVDWTCSTNAGEEQRV